jgi:amino acid transporter
MICNPVIDQLIGCSNGDVALAVLLARLFRTIMIVGGLALLMFMAWGGVNWITAGGDKGKVEEAKHRITNAILGMIFLVATIAIAIFLSTVFGFNLLNPTLPINTPSGNVPGGTVDTELPRGEQRWGGPAE